MLGDLQSVERATHAGALLHLAEVADELEQSFALLDLEQAHERRAEGAAAARGLRDREPGTRRGRKAGTDIKTSRDRDARPGKAEHQGVDLLAAQSVPAFPHHVADVAEPEQVAGEPPGGAGDVLGFTRDETAREACGLA